MNAFIYQADLYCESCGQSIRDRLTKDGKAPEDPEDEHSYDSDNFPKGPEPDGGGEADSEQHCAACGVALDNPLTEEGMQARAEAMGRKYLELDSDGPFFCTRKPIPYSADELRSMLDALERTSEELPLSDEGHAVFDSMTALLEGRLKASESSEFARAHTGKGKEKR